MRFLPKLPLLISLAACGAIDVHHDQNPVQVPDGGEDVDSGGNGFDASVPHDHDDAGARDGGTHDAGNSDDAHVPVGDGDSGPTSVDACVPIQVFEDHDGDGHGNAA